MVGEGWVLVGEGLLEGEGLLVGEGCWYGRGGGVGREGGRLHSKVWTDAHMNTKKFPGWWEPDGHSLNILLLVCHIVHVFPELVW